MANYGIIAAMRSKVFISSVQREFAAERQMLAEYVRRDALLGKFATHAVMLIKLNSVNIR